MSRPGGLGASGAQHPGPSALGARHHEVQRLRSLLRDRRARDDEHMFVLEGPRVIGGALDAGAELETVYLGDGAARGFAALLDRLDDAGVRVRVLKEGVLEKVGTTRTPQPVLAVAPKVTRPFDELASTGLVLVAVGIADPGNLGTLVRAAAAAGAAGVLVCGGVDVHSPKVVRASAGALFAVPLVETGEGGAAAILDELGRLGRRRLGARADAKVRYDDADLTGTVALVVGNEAYGLDDELAAHLDETIAIPMTDALDSLNVAMAGTVVCFEAARQRRVAEAKGVAAATGGAATGSAATGVSR